MSYQRKEFQQRCEWLVALRNFDGSTKEIFVQSPPPERIAIPVIEDLNGFEAIWRGDEQVIRPRAPRFGQRIYSWTPGDYTVSGLRVYR